MRKLIKITTVITCFMFVSFISADAAQEVRSIVTEHASDVVNVQNWLIGILGTVIALLLGAGFKSNRDEMKGMRADIHNLVIVMSQYEQRMTRLETRCDIEHGQLGRRSSNNEIHLDNRVG